MESHDPLQDGAGATYNAASEDYDAPALRFRDRLSQTVVARLNLPQGARVLDVCCGTGAAALAAASAVGPLGSVLGLDVAERQLARARAKANSLGLVQAEFRLGNLDSFVMPVNSFDASLCTLGIFFVRDMAAALARLWQTVRPGGVLAVTTWAERAFEPGNAAFWSAVQEIRPDLVRTFPWHKIDRPSLLAALFAEAGVPEASIEDVQAEQPLAVVDDWWVIARGSGFRATLEQMSLWEQTKVCELNLAALRAQNVRSIAAPALIGTARKPRARTSP